MGVALIYLWLGTALDFAVLTLLTLKVVTQHHMLETFVSEEPAASLLAYRGD
jgi:heme exporter protein D